MAEEKKDKKTKLSPSYTAEEIAVIDRAAYIVGITRAEFGRQAILAAAKRYVPGA